MINGASSLGIPRRMGLRGLSETCVGTICGNVGRISDPQKEREAHVAEKAEGWFSHFTLFCAVHSLTYGIRVSEQQSSLNHNSNSISTHQGCVGARGSRQTAQEDGRPDGDA